MQPVQLLSILAFAVSSNFDNVGVGVAYGMRGYCVPSSSNLIIALLNGGGTLVSMLAGMSLYRVLEPRVSALIGGAVMIGIGIWVVAEGTRHLGGAGSMKDELYRRSQRLSGMTVPGRIWAIINNPFVVHPDCSGTMGKGESTLIGSGLTMTNLVTGLAAGMMGLNVFLLTFVTMILSMIAVCLGVRAGNSVVFRWIGRYSGAVSGLLLVSIGILEIMI